MRVLTVVICTVLAGCSVFADDHDPYSTAKYIPPSPPTPVAQVKGLQRAISDEKLVAPVQISDVRSASNGGPGAYLICITGPRKDGSNIGYYAAFFENEAFKSVRPSVILDLCESQPYRPADFPLTPPPKLDPNDLKRETEKPAG
jgi:hypothetical protein